MPRVATGAAPLITPALTLALLATTASAPAAASVPPAVHTSPQARGELANDAFRIEYDDSGIRSLRRTNDVHDTEYLAADGALGRLLVRYRTAPHGDWRELSGMRLRSAPPVSDGAIQFELGASPPGLASLASPGAERGVGGLRGLSDGRVPSPGQQVPLFSWTTGPNEPGTGGVSEPGVRRWVQYTFPEEREVGRTEVFWVNPPEGWRLLYQQDAEWKEVTARDPYGTGADAFIAVEFEPVTTVALRIEVTMPPGSRVSLAEWRVGPEPELIPAVDLTATQRFDLDGEALDWTLTLSNPGPRPVELGDLAVPLAFAERVGAREDIYTTKLIRHAFVGGHGSWVYWLRSNGVGPYLLMMPTGDTALEYFDGSGGRGSVAGPGARGADARPAAFTPYVHARAAAAEAIAAGGDWRLPVSGRVIPPRGAATYSFRFVWVPDVAGMRRALVDQGGIDVVSVPGMVVPSDLPALVSLRTEHAIAAVESEYPAETEVSTVETEGGGTNVYRVRFSKLGENLLTVRYGDGRLLTLEFFVTEPLETVIRKRAAFLVARQQHTDPSKWYAGVYGDWDQKNEILRGPEDRDELSTWLTDATDDAGNARPAFVAAKNVFFPEQREIESLEHYLRDYLWGGMQMTESERYPYALFGVPNWMANRASADEGRNGGAHVWRIYDYPHIVLLYHRMYRIARFYPERMSYLDAEGYLERAYRTAVAYWTVPLEIEGWSADAVGTMNETIIPELIETLEAEGRTEWAATLRGFWEGKVDRFVNRPPNLYGSEFAFDSTGFESTGAMARYAMRRDTPEFRSLVSREAAEEFLRFQLRLNIADRGWPEPTYYQLGSDYRGNPTYLLSYMSQLGGGAILDYALEFAADPTDALRLGYASALSSWALVNSGTADSGHGYWFPSPGNDGAAGGGFMPEASGRAWIGKAVRRGAWHYSAEQDVGYAGALRNHATIVARDPIFGEIAYGGVLERTNRAVRVVPRDGLRVRFHVVRDDQRLYLALDHDGFAREQPIIVADDLSGLEFVLENRTSGEHETGLSIAGLPPGEYTVAVEGRAVATIRGTAEAQVVGLPVGPAATSRVTIARGG